MLSAVIENTGLWKRTLSPSISDEFQQQRAALATAFATMRNNIHGIVGEIASSCKGLTIHAITHLDALWETADEIIGPDYQVNPVEAFVFGASVLLHDSALALVAYPGGESALKATVEWSDMEGALRRRRSIEERKSPLSKADEEYLTFQVLRRLHAAQAEKLAMQAWPLPSKHRAYLLDNLELRQAYGKSIGRIAHSHHWDIDKVAEEMRSGLGASPELPSQWTLSELKVACMLRCADAAHIDRRRAPTVLMAGKLLSGASADHWAFQNRLNRPALREEALVFASGEDFSLDQAEAWWLSYATIQQIDKEIRSSNSVLSEQGFQQFAAKRVAGADTPRTLEKYITTVGWKPVNTDIHVTDPISLARTLGGANLYGNDHLAPVRELVQNGVDAVRARRKIEERQDGWGFVRISAVTDNNGKSWLHVDDTGIGMSERMITESLLDFGTSSWQSSIIQDEFPGLESKGISPVGKFGIGFFSAFLLGDHVKVITKKFRGAETPKMLTFTGLSRKPILQDTAEETLPLDCSTRISVELANPEFLSVPIETSSYGYRQRAEIPPPAALRRLFSGLDVRIIFDDQINDEHFEHSPDWQTSASSEFLSSLSTGSDSYYTDIAISVHRDLLQLVTDDDGTVYGRAAISITPRNYIEGLSRISVGGFVIDDERTSSEKFYVGLMNGETEVASRATGKLSVPKNVLERWANGQVKLLDHHRLHPQDLLPVCHRLLRLGADTQELPFCLIGKNIVSYRKFREWLNGADEVKIPVLLLERDYDDEKEFKYISLGVVARDVLFYGLNPSFICATDSEEDVLLFMPEDSDLSEAEIHGTTLEFLSSDLAPGRESVIHAIMDAIRRTWLCDPIVSISPEPYLDADTYFKPELTWALRISRP